MASKTDNDVDVEVLVIGAGVVGIYALYRAIEAGFTAQTLEAGDGVGGVWYWNRYPAARFDSESYTYGYLFSKELFDEWKWEEEFATQPEIERYLNHVVDRFALRAHIRTGQRVVSAVWNEDDTVWEVTTEQGETIRARWVISATGGLSVPHYPEIDGIDDFQGEGHHTGAWPHEQLDFTGKRVAIIGNGPSGAQILPAIVDIVEQVDLYQRTPTWTTPLNNAPMTDEKRTWLSENFAAGRADPHDQPDRVHAPTGRQVLHGGHSRGAPGVLRGDLEGARLRKAHVELLRHDDQPRGRTSSSASSSPARSAAS